MVINSSNAATDQEPVVTKDSVVTFDVTTDTSSSASSPSSLPVKEPQNEKTDQSMNQRDSPSGESRQQPPAETSSHHSPIIVRESHSHHLEETASFVVEDELRSISAMDFGEVSGLMREQDADLLERHQSQTPNDATPQLAAALDGPLPPPLTLEIPVKRPWRRQTSRVRSSGSEAAPNTATATSVPASVDATTNASTILPSTSAVSSGDEAAEVPQSRLFLAGEVYEQQIVIQEEATAAVADDAASASNIHLKNAAGESSGIATSTSNEILESVTALVHEESMIDNVNLDTSILTEGVTERPIRRSESMDRFVQLSEAAQFAEAVGDATVAEDLRILEEDRSDDDDDDDDESDAQGTLLSSEAIQPTSQQVPSMVAINLPPLHPLQKQEPTSQPPSIMKPPSAAESHPQAATLREAHSSAAVAVTANAASSEPPKSPFKTKSLRSVVRRRRVTTKRGFLDQLPSSQQQGHCDFVYKGLKANPPEIVKRGTNRGNYAQLHRKAWLEVSDKYHRYGKNLRFYYRHWESLGCPFNMFFDWLDSKGEAAGQPLPEIEKCPRAILDSDTVLYIADPEESEDYALAFVPDEHGRGRVVDPIDGEAVCTGPDGWIFVLRDNQIYGAQKITSATGHLSKQRFHHSSFFGGKAVAAAGIFITDDQGYLTRLYPHSGHYRPREAHMQRVLFFLHHQGVDLRTFDMDMQQILHVARDVEPPKKEEKKEENGEGDDANKDGECKTTEAPPLIEKKPEKKKKVESLFLIPAVLAACFLAHKARFIGAGIFEQLHKIRRADVSTVSEALDFIEPPAEP